MSTDTTLASESAAVSKLVNNLKNLKSMIEEPGELPATQRRILIEIVESCLTLAFQLFDPPASLPTYLYTLFTTHNMAQSRLYESQIDAKVLALLQLFFSVYKKFLIMPQWSLNPEVDQNVLDMVKDWSTIAVEEGSVDNSSIRMLSPTVELHSDNSTKDLDNLPVPIVTAEQPQVTLPFPGEIMEPDASFSSEDVLEFDDSDVQFSPSFSYDLHHDANTIPSSLTNFQEHIAASSTPHNHDRLSFPIPPFLYDSTSMESFDIPVEKVDPSFVAHAALDSLGRLVINHPGRLKRYVPDFLVSRFGKSVLAVEDKLLNKTNGMEQLIRYLDLLDDGTYGMTAALGENFGLDVAICRRTGTSPDGKAEVKWLHGPAEPVRHWYGADDPFVLESLKGIHDHFMEAI
ncbi:hypothetical protein D9758_018093 [Tetrapyrgos nigripes]|uniref:Uncharacterized protein n=1 Tax=Tetrapyrgos nigripes TaxID=182062 RepID=A0A8H5BYR6_9AGAR|nr:hypothetical protein D9758_018093 [Tetrapyrgos nigripes]